MPTTYTTTERRARFWNRVEMCGDDCWDWTGTLNTNGYGQAWDGHATRPAPCIAYELTRGSVPKGMCVCHTCDNPKCCNPSHLWLGTKLQNTRDMIAKGRNPKRNMGRLTADDIASIRLRFVPTIGGRHNGGINRALAAEYGVTLPTILDVGMHRRAYAD